MNTIIIDGNKVSKKIQKKIIKKIVFFKKNKFRSPGLAIIMIGNNNYSKIYIKKKEEMCNYLGFFFRCYIFSENIKEEKILKKIDKLNKNKKIDGIIVQLPLPKKLNTTKILSSIDPKKDVDGYHPCNSGWLLCKKLPILRSCTSKGIITLLKNYNIKIMGLHAVIIGASILVGRPICMELLLLGCTVTITHKETKNLKKYVKMADLIIIAIGVPKFLNGSWVKKGSIVIDVGINYVPGTKKIVGDVDFNSVFKKTSYITPVPGGVGPMTVISLLQNTLNAYEAYHKK